MEKLKIDLSKIDPSIRYFVEDNYILLERSSDKEMEVELTFDWNSEEFESIEVIVADIFESDIIEVEKNVPHKFELKGNDRKMVITFPINIHKNEISVIEEVSDFSELKNDYIIQLDQEIEFSEKMEIDEVKAELINIKSEVLLANSFDDLIEIEWTLLRKIDEKYYIVRYLVFEGLFLDEKCKLTDSAKYDIDNNSVYMNSSDIEAFKHLQDVVNENKGIRFVIAEDFYSKEIENNEDIII